MGMKRSSMMHQIGISQAESMQREFYVPDMQYAIFPRKKPSLTYSISGKAKPKTS